MHSGECKEGSCSVVEGISHHTFVDSNRIFRRRTNKVNNGLWIMSNQCKFITICLLHFYLFELRSHYIYSPG